MGVGRDKWGGPRACEWRNHRFFWTGLLDDQTAGTARKIVWTSFRAIITSGMTGHVPLCAIMSVRFIGFDLNISQYCICTTNIHEINTYSKDWDTEECQWHFKYRDLKFNPFMTVDYSTLVEWMSPFSTQGYSNWFCLFSSFLNPFYGEIPMCLTYETEFVLF